MVEKYLSINCEYFESGLWLDEKFSRGQAWLDLLFLANSSTKRGVYNFHEKIFNKGSVYRSNSFLAERWHWSTSKVSGFLNNLRDTGRIKVIGRGIEREVQIIDYEKYQIILYDTAIKTLDNVNITENYCDDSFDNDDEDALEEESEEDTWFDQL